MRGGRAFRSSVAVSVTDEIDLLFAPELSREEIERAVCEAANDLYGSVSQESLPEMAIKLAAVRLERARHGERSDASWVSDAAAHAPSPGRDADD